MYVATNSKSLTTFDGTTMTKLTRSVHFAATSHIILFPKDDLIDTSRSWYLEEDKARFRRVMIQHAHQLRTAIRLGFVHPQDFSEDVLIYCTGIETLVLFSESMLSVEADTRDEAFPHPLHSSCPAPSKHIWTICFITQELRERSTDGIRCSHALNFERE